MDKNQVISAYNEFNEGIPIVVSAPGRINIIGEHTDYNNGFVLPAAIDKRMLIALGKNEKGGTSEIRSLDFKENLVLNLSELPDKLSGWQGYIIAVLNELRSRKLNFDSFNCVFGSDIPIGAGMSSSAALTCGIISALDEVNGWQLNKLDIAKIAQASEHRLGANVGLMDQFAVMSGKKNEVILLDCLDYSHRYYPLDLKEYSLILINTNVKHQLVASEYNDRRASCERTLALLQEANPDIKTLRDVTLDILNDAEEVSDEDKRRVGYVILENDRVLKTTLSLKDNDFKQVGELMYQSHEGLSKEYKVSCKELDLLVELAREENAVLGARMMGGGFGGCTINLIKTAAANSSVLRIMEKYKKQTDIRADYYTVCIDNGLSKL